MSAQAQLASAQTDVDSAQARLVNARAKLDEVTQGASDADRAAAEATLQAAQASADAAHAKSDTLGQVKPDDLAAARQAVHAAEGEVRDAQAKLDQLKQGARPDAVELVKSALAAAHPNLAAKSGANVRGSDIALAQLAVRQAELSVQQAQRDVDNTTLVAPFDGIVAAINGNPGETAPVGSSSSSNQTGSTSNSAAGGFMTLIDPHSMRVDVTIDETDMPRIKLGQSSAVAFDALPGHTFTGAVSSISPLGVSNQGVVSYPVSISIDSADQLPPPGLTANASITVDARDGVLLAPVRAVCRRGHDQTVEVVGPSGELTSRSVTTGISNDQQVEISNGLAEGERIAIPSTSTRAPTVTGPGASVQVGR